MARDREGEIRIANEGLRLVQACKMPRFCSSEGSGHKEQQQRLQEWTSRVPDFMPPLLDWIDQHQHRLFDVAWDAAPAVKEFQKHFLLVYLEQVSGFIRYRYPEDAAHWRIVDRLFMFGDDVERILSTNTAIWSWLFHYYGSELGLQGWLCRPDVLYSLYQLCEFLDHQKLDVLFGQRMLSFLERMGKEMMGFPPIHEYQKVGTKLMATVMEIGCETQNYTNDADKILRMALQRDEDCEELWSVIYYSVQSIRNAKDGSLADEVMLNLLAHLDEELLKRQAHPNRSLDERPLTYARTVTLLLLLDVPGVDLKDCEFDELTISGRLCDWESFRRHMKAQYRTTVNPRYSIHMRIRIAKMIPKLFAGLASVHAINVRVYKCMTLLTWSAMFPISQTKQQKKDRAIMLKRLLEEVKRVLDIIIKDQSDYDVSEFYVLHKALYPLLSAIQDGVGLLPNAGWFRKHRYDMRRRMTPVVYNLRLLKYFQEQREAMAEEEGL